MCVSRCCNIRRLNSDHDSSRENFRICRPYNRNTANVEFKNESDASNNRGNWNHLKSLIKHLNNAPEKQNIKELQKISRIGHCTHTAESKGEDKAIPLQVWTGPSESRKMRIPEFLDIRHLKVVRFSNLRTSPLYPQEISLIFVLEAVSTPGP